jgi:hypothetical protein
MTRALKGVKIGAVPWAEMLADLQFINYIKLNILKWLK